MKEIQIDNDLYPNKLKTIKSPPKVLYTEGNLELLNSNSIAIIGSRNCSENGKKIAAKFSFELSSIGITIISGLAIGIDTVAHTYSYNNIGKTIAVLGSGFNNIFPYENMNLYKKILENNGLIISEYPPNQKAESGFFLKRNRIVSGLSLGIFVVEAFFRSGTSVTAKIAKNQGKQIFTVPHEIWDSRGVGTNRLLKNGANLVINTTDILDVLNLNKEKEQYFKLYKQGYFSNEHNNLLKPDLSKSNNNKFKNPKHSKIYECISNSNSSISVNELAHLTGFSVNEILSILFVLELDGYIKKSSGGYICI